MEVFLDYPLYLEIDDNITCKMRVANVNGWSNFTSEFQITTVKAKPQVRVPFLQVGPKTDSQSIHIMWGGLNTSPGNGGEGVLVGYVLYWAKSDFNSEWRRLGYTYTTQFETKDKTAEELSVGQQYKFMV
jgi:hypothetical protein